MTYPNNLMFAFFPVVTVLSGEGIGAAVCRATAKGTASRGGE